MIDRRQLVRRVRKSGLAILDQGLVTGSNFFISIILARWLPADQYGAYALVFSIFLLIGMLYQSLLLEPMGVFGASVYKNRFRGYFKAVLALHAFSSLLMMVVICLAAGIAFNRGGTKSLIATLLCMALASPLILLFWLVKRAFYVLLSPGPSTVAGFLYCGLTLGTLSLAYRYHWLAPPTAFLLMGIGSLGATIPLLIYLMRILSSDVSGVSLSETWRRHWGYGRWALGSSALAWVPVNIFFPLASTFSGMKEAGELKALLNLSAPVWQPVAALSTLLLPYATQIQEKRGSVGAGLLSRQVSLVFMLGTITYWGLVLLFRDSIFHHLYSGRYAGLMYLLPVMALGSICWSGFVGPANALRAMESPVSVFIAVGAASAAAVIIGIPFTRFLGLKGAVWGMTISQGVGFVAAATLLYGRVHNRGSQRLELYTANELPRDSAVNS